MPDSASPIDPPQFLSRRELLKALGVTGSALAAAAFLPGKWVKPAISAGVLPAHAQASCSANPPTVLGGDVPFSNGLFSAGLNYIQGDIPISGSDLIVYSVVTPCGNSEGSTTFDKSNGWNESFFSFSGPYNCNEAGSLYVSISQNGCAGPVSGPIPIYFLYPAPL